MAPVVTNPGAQSGTVGTAITPLQIVATDGNGDALSFSATGLPAGLSISTAGLVTGTPTTAGANSVTVTANDGKGGTGSATRVARACVLVDPPSIDRGEVTDKGAINRRAAPFGALALGAFEESLEPGVLRYGDRLLLVDAVSGDFSTLLDGFHSDGGIARLAVS